MIQILLIIKASLFIFKVLFYIMFDLVAYYSFISNKAASELNLKIYSSKEKWSFLSVQKKNFSLFNICLEYFYEMTFKSKFCILPKM